MNLTFQDYLEAQDSAREGLKKFHHKSFTGKILLEIIKMPFEEWKKRTELQIEMFESTKNMTLEEILNMFPAKNQLTDNK